LSYRGCRAEREQGWEPEYYLERMNADFYAEIADPPQDTDEYGILPSKRKRAGSTHGMGLSPGKQKG
jgi:hypothetical protein